MLHGVEVRELLEAHEVRNGAHGVTFVFRTSDGGRAALFLDFSEIYARAYQFQLPTCTPIGAALQ